MNEQIYITLLSLSGAIILITIGIIGYFLNRIILVLDNFDKTLRAFSEDYSATKERVTNMQEGCKDRHEVINNRLNDHSRRLDKHELSIGKIEVKIDNY